MAQIRDLLVAGKAKFLGTGAFSGLLDAAGGLKISGASKITTNPTYIYAQNPDTSEVSYINVDDVMVGTAKALNTASKGAKNQPIYWTNGVPVAIEESIGGTDTPVYLNKGVITKLSATAGGTAKPVYLSGGQITPLTATVGTAKKPVYLSSGTITVSNADVGNDALPMYMSGGEFKTVNIIGTSAGGTGNSTFTQGRLIYASSATKLSAHSYASTSEATITLTRTDANQSKFVAKNSSGAVSILTQTNRGLYDETKSAWIVYTNTEGTGTYIPHWKSIGSGTKFIYIDSNGAAAASTSTVGASNRPVYLSSGTVTAVGTIATAYGGTGSSSHTKNRVVITDSSGNLVTTSSEHYATGTAIYINAGSSNLPGGDEKLYVKGSAQVDGHLSLDNEVKFEYNSTDKCVDVIFI